MAMAVIGMKKNLKVCLQIFLNFGRENLVVQFGVWGSINFIFLLQLL